MRHNNSRRMKNRQGGHNGGHNNGGQRRGGGGGGNHGGVTSRTQVFDSNGPDVRIRGTAWQVHEKYLALAKDAAAVGDHIMAENYLQHAEHYQRIINAFNESQAPYVRDTGGTYEEGEQQAAATGEEPQPLQVVRPSQQQQAQQPAPMRDEELGLPASLFRPVPTGSLESA